MIKEACIENATLLEDYIRAGVNRVELCDNLAVGGTTVSFATMEYAKSVCKYNNVELATLIRARGGDFIYNDFEKNIMLKDLKNFVKLGVDRIVIGALNNSLSVDEAYIEELIKTALLINPNINISFHMAFDNICVDKAYNSDASIKKRVATIKILADMGIDTILTHGSNIKNSIFENIDILNEYIREGNNCGISIMPGGGVNYINIKEVVDKLAYIDAIHGSKIVKI